MADAAFALQKAIVSRLTADTALLSLLGGARVYDDVPEREQFPYITFGHSVERDFSTGSDGASEHTLTLHVWSRARGRKEALSILQAARAALHDNVLTLEGHRLVNLRHEFSDARRENDGESFHATMRFRAITEPL